MDCTIVRRNAGCTADRRQHGPIDIRLTKLIFMGGYFMGPGAHQVGTHRELPAKKGVAAQGCAAPGRVHPGRRGTGHGVGRLPRLRTMSAMLSGVIVVAAFGLVAVLGIMAVAALFRVTRQPSADSSRGSESGD
jgi:hypothetical protein